MTFVGLTPEVGATWLLSLSSHDHKGVDSRPMKWPVREAILLQATSADAPDVAVEIESLEYTYRAGIEGPLVTYPASSDGGSVV